MANYRASFYVALLRPTIIHYINWRNPHKNERLRQVISGVRMLGFKIHSSTNEERSSERESEEGPTITSNSPGSTTYLSSEL